MSLFMFFRKSPLKILLVILLVINIMKITLQEELDKELIKIVKSLRERANSKKIEYSKYEIPKNLSNYTNFTEYDNITNIAIFLNRTGLSYLKQSVSNQRSSGIKKEFITKYLDSISKRFEFTEEIKEYFKPLFLNITEEENNKWKNYELLYQKKSSNTTLFVCILAKNLQNLGKIDFIINQVELEYQLTNFLILKINTCDKNGKEHSDYKFVKTDVENTITDYEIEATLNVLASTGYNSLADFLDIKDSDYQNLFLSYLQ